MTMCGWQVSYFLLLSPQLIHVGGCSGPLPPAKTLLEHLGIQALCHRFAFFELFRSGHKQ